jgi:cyclohexanone monooxygenase
MATGPETAELGFSPEALKEKYRQEREKRLRPEGQAQYLEFSGVFSDFDVDPYVDPGFTRDPIDETVDVVIVGGGFGGMLAGARLREAGVHDFRIIDKGGDFGGTWYWNRYPGAACDVESYIYLPLLEETGYVPTEKYAKAPEIFEHVQRIANHYDLYKAAILQTDVTGLQWDEASKLWRVSTDRDDKLQARFVIVAGGVLHKPKLPGIAGIETFKGHSFHTCRWDYAYTGGSPTTPMDRLKDKRVGIIGTGATAIQAVPKLAEAAKDLYVFQRTPSGVGVRNNAPTDPAWASTLQPGWAAERRNNFTVLTSGLPAERDLVGDGWTEILRYMERDPDPARAEELRQIADFKAMEAIRARIDAIVKDKKTAEALKPYYNQMCKRPCFHDDYLASFNRPNVHLVDTAGKGVQRINEAGVVVDGVEYPLDLLIYASGFEVTTPYHRRLGFDIHGRDGAISQQWAEGASTLHGVMSRGFPNLLMESPIQGAQGINFVHVLDELSGHIAYVVKKCLDTGVETVEPTQAAQEAWLGTVFQTLMGRAAFAAECTPGYYNNEGVMEMRGARNAPFMGPTPHMFEILRTWREADAFEGLEVRRHAASKPEPAMA